MVKKRWLGPAIALGLAVLLTGCGSAGTGSSTRSGGDTLSETEIHEALAANLYEVVEQLRPRWLQVRSPTSMTAGAVPAEIGVFINRTHQGGVEILRNLTVDGVTGMRYMDGPQASAALRTAGGTALAGAIVIERSN